jgi:tetratricopeptide (TPR) repeat protein
MRFYCHYEPPDTAGDSCTPCSDHLRRGGFTAAVERCAAATVVDVLEDFIAQYAKKRGAILTGTWLGWQLTCRRHGVILLYWGVGWSVLADGAAWPVADLTIARHPSGEQPLWASDRIGGLLRAGGDIFVVDTSWATVLPGPKPEQVPRVRSRRSTGGLQSIASLPQRSRACAQEPTWAEWEAVEREATAREADPSTSQGERAVMERAAIAMRQSTAAVQGHQWAKAARLHAEVFAADPTNLQCRYQQALIELALGRHAEAERHLLQALDATHKPTDPELFIKLGDACLGKGDSAAALQHYDTGLGLANGSGTYDEDAVDGIKIKMAKALTAAGKAEVGLELVTVVLRRNEQHFTGLLYYGEAMTAAGNGDDEAMRVYLRLLVSHSDDKDVRTGFGALLQREGALELLKQNLQVDAPSSAPAFAFLASVVKDQGGVAECLELYGIACRADGENTNYVLNYIHTFELLCRYPDAYNTALAFLAQNSTKRAGDLTAAAVAQLLEGRDLGSWAAGADAVAVAVYLPPETRASRTAKAAPLGAGSLDLLALLFTVCKIGFVVGDLGLLPPLLALLEPEAEGRELHKTLVRNEAAYYGCVKQLLPLLAAEAAAPVGDTGEIHVVGDSHSLALGWHCVELQGRSWLLRPRLVTGLKCWHMRPGGCFYPKVNLEHVVAGVPCGAKVCGSAVRSTRL